MSDVGTITNTHVSVKIPARWNVVLHNDDYTPMEFVVRVLMEIFNHPRATATDLMWQVHRNGQAIAGTYTLDVAETKVSDVMQVAYLCRHPFLATVQRG